MLIYDYEYDLIHQPFFTKILDEENAVKIKFIVQDGIRVISGFLIKLSREGKPGSIHYKLSSSMDDGCVLEGDILTEEVTPVYELFVKRTFAPVPVRPGEAFFLTLKVFNGKMPLDGYRIYGPRQCQTGNDTFDGAEIIPYWWSQEYCGGMGVPSYYKPAAYIKCSWCCSLDGDNTEGPGFSIGLLTCESDEGCSVSQRFEFIKELTAPPYSEWYPVEKENFSEGCMAGNHNSVIIDETWGLDFSRITMKSPLTGNIYLEAKTFFRRIFSLDLKGNINKIVFDIDENAVPEGNESHIIIADEKNIVLKAGSERGLMRALHYLEDTMIERRLPAVKKGIHRRKSLYNLRMTSGISPAPFNYYALKSSGIWSDGYMWRLSRSGYNAVWFIVNLEEIVLDSLIFPEMNDTDAAVALERLERITEMAAGYGVDVYVEIRTGYYKQFAEKIYERLPEIRSFPKWANLPCTGNEHFKDFLKETLENLINRVKLLKGIIVIYDTEGFYNCFAHAKQDDCPICRGKGAEILAAEFFSTLKKSAKAAKRDIDFIAWTYFCDEDWNYRIIAGMPEDIKVMACYSQFVRIDRFGIKNMTDDYACSVTGPGEYFSKVFDAAGKSGLKVLAKTEVSFGNEFISTPYIPSILQFQKRWDSMSGKALEGFMGDYIHNGFKPSPCTDLMRVNIFETLINNNEWLTSEEKVKWVASLNFGKEAADKVVKAWELFSKAISGFFPFSSGVCRYPGPLQAGPSQPFYLDMDRKIDRIAAGYNTPNLEWTKQKYYEINDPGWNEDLVLKCFISFKHIYEEGIRYLEEAVDRVDCSNKEMSKMIGIAKMQNCMAESMINFIQFAQLREKLKNEALCRGTLEEIIQVCKNELLNSARALELCEADSLLGFSCEGQGAIRGGNFTPFTIKDKIRELEITTAELEKMLQSL